MTRSYHISLTADSMRSGVGLLLVLFLLAMLFPVLTHAQSDAQSNSNSSRCASLSNANFSQLPDAPTQITSATLVASDGDVPEYCQVAGYVSPQVGFLLRLPSTKWNGKFLQLGCGGFCGSTAHIVQCQYPLRRGYACIVTDMGHQGAGGLWASHNLQTQIDFGYRSTHVTALAGKAIAENYYGHPPRYAYFHGCSTGGREALMEAQRFPWDFDGILAGAPVVSAPDIHMNLLWLNRFLTNQDGTPILTKQNLDTLHNAVLSKCDLNDGIKDGLIGDPQACSFDPRELLCADGRKTDCLNKNQYEAVTKIYGNVVNSRNEFVYLPAAMRGSERTWLDWPPTALAQFLTESFRYFQFDPAAGPTWKLQDFDFDRDYQRLGVAQGFAAAANPDLRRYKAAGGKLIAYAGWNDSGVTPLAIVDYYEIAEKTLGGRAPTQDFFQLFMIPGMNHCTGGDGAFAIDYLKYLEAWVENDHAPDKLIGAHVQLEAANQLQFPLTPAQIRFSRPFYPYPIQTKYLGRGDSNNAASYGPAMSKKHYK